jgi:putative DNA primase/helicase
MAFDPELLPYSFRTFAEDTADRMQCPIDFVAVALVVCLGGAVSRRARVQPKAQDSGWMVTPNLWGAIVALPGQLKTPTLAAAAKPLRDIEEEARTAHAKAMEGHAREVEMAELRLSAWKEQAKKSLKPRSGGEVDETSMPERPPDPPKSPTMRRFIVNDATFEALHQTMSENPAGILVFRDELVGWWSQLDKSGREGERGFCLQAWNGDTGHTIDRIGRGTIYVEACCMSMLGGIQPGRLRNYLEDALTDGPGNDGLIQRFQLLVWPDVPATWQYVDRRPDKTAEAEVARIFKRLVRMDAENPKLLRFAEAAQELFIEWLTGLELRLRGGAIHPALEAHLSKYRSLMPSLAVLFCLAEWAADGGELEAIPLHPAQQAAAWCEYLESHAHRLYSCITTPQMRAARELAKKLKTGELGAEGSFTARDVYGNGWSGLDTPETVKAAADVLADSGWIRCESVKPGPGGGRPSTRYVVNPKVRK